MRDQKSKPIQEVAISKFKADCFFRLRKVSKTGAALRVTCRGKAVADIVPIPTVRDERSWLGRLEGSVKILGDVISPVIDLRKIEATKRRR